MNTSALKKMIPLGLALGLCLQWIFLRQIDLNWSAPWQPVLPGLAVFGAAFLLSWAAELAQMDIPQALALAFVALVAVLPEYAVDMYFAWIAGKDPSYIPYVTANMTGGNRLLIGVGWAAVVFAFWYKTGRKGISLEPGHRLEIFSLTAATIYSFIIPFKKNMSLMDSFFLLIIFAAYMIAAARSHMVEPELGEGPVESLSRLPALPRRIVTLFLFLLAGFSIIRAAGPFAEGLLATGKQLGVEEFLLVQWLAPLASESPEFIVAILFAVRGKPSAGIGTLVSSKVNQWTLLVGMLPIAYALSSHATHPLTMDARQAEEVLLTSAQSLFAIILLCDLEFSLWDGVVIFVLFVTQLFFTSTAQRLAYSGVYLVLAAGLLATRPSLRQGLATTCREGFRKINFFRQ
ncbi:MAG: sodium:calcium antiporter [Elusimicrobiota bacterium]|jgi:cation:H+ antiporter